MLNEINNENNWLKEYGFYTHYVSNDDIPTQINIHTHGLPDSFDHPDLQIVLPLNPQTASSILHSIVNWIKQGNGVKTNTPYSFILKGMDAMFVWAVECDRDVLRLILPDTKGKLLPEEMQDPYTLQWLDTYPERKGLGFRQN
jgi:hypothetical protein